MLINAARTTLMVVGTSASVCICKRQWHWLDSSLGIVSCLSGIALFIGYGVARTSLVVYVAYAAGMWQFVSVVAVQAIISESVGVDEQAQVLSVASVAQGVSVFLGGLAYSAMFNATIELLWSGFSFMLSALVMLVPLGIFCYIDIQLRRSTDVLL